MSEGIACEVRSLLEHGAFEGSGIREGPGSLDTPACDPEEGKVPGALPVTDISGGNCPLPMVAFRTQALATLPTIFQRGADPGVSH